MSRIITPEGMVPGQDGKPDRPPTMEERLALALNLWKLQRKDEAFATTLNCIAYLSHGMAGMAKHVARIEKQNVALHERLIKLESDK